VIRLVSISRWGRSVKENVTGAAWRSGSILGWMLN